MADGEASSDRLLTREEVAEMFRVNPRTVTRWANEGLLVAIRAHPRGQRRYRLSQVMELLDGKQ